MLPGQAGRRAGLPGRARSIATNVPRPRTAGVEDGWTDNDRDLYERAGNVAAEIRLAAEKREHGTDKAGTRRVTPAIAGAVLFRHYARVFTAGSGDSLPIQQAHDRAPGLFNLHMAIKDCSRLLKHHRKDERTHGPGRRKVSALLPATMEALYDLVDNKNANRDTNALIRLGKIIRKHPTSAAAA